MYVSSKGTRDSPINEGVKTFVGARDAFLPWHLHIFFEGKSLIGSHSRRDSAAALTRRPRARALFDPADVNKQTAPNAWRRDAERGGEGRERIYRVERDASERVSKASNLPNQMREISIWKTAIHALGFPFPA